MNECCRLRQFLLASAETAVHAPGRGMLRRAAANTSSRKARNADMPWHPDMALRVPMRNMVLARPPREQGESGRRFGRPERSLNWRSRLWAGDQRSLSGESADGEDHRG